MCSYKPVRETWIFANRCVRGLRVRGCGGMGFSKSDCGWTTDICIVEGGWYLFLWEDLQVELGEGGWYSFFLRGGVGIRAQYIVGGVERCEAL